MLLRKALNEYECVDDDGQGFPVCLIKHLGHWANRVPNPIEVFDHLSGAWMEGYQGESWGGTFNGALIMLLCLEQS